MFTPFLGDWEQDQMLRQLVFAMNVGCSGEMTATNGVTAKALKVETEVQTMIGTVVSEMDTGIGMKIAVGLPGMINTGSRERSGDGRGRGRGL